MELMEGMKVGAMSFLPLLGSLAPWVSRRQVSSLNKDPLEFYIWFFLLTTGEEAKEKDKK